MSFLFYMTKYF